MKSRTGKMMKNAGGCFRGSGDGRTVNVRNRVRRAAVVLAAAVWIGALAGCGVQEKAVRDHVGAEAMKTDKVENAVTADEAPEAGNAGIADAGTEAVRREMTGDADAETGTAEADGTDAEKNRDGEEQAQQQKPATMADLLRESGNEVKKPEPPELPETVLWFNATYACLTYTNGWDWRWIGGLEPTEENVSTAQYLLYSSWDVLDRESGMETVDKLLAGGHRAKCRECMEDLEAWGLMDLSEARFLEEFSKAMSGKRTDIDLGDVPGRYVVAFCMRHAGIEPEYIAAWDLCRVNQLYADFYLCGFMSYEEAMDASLENSLALQKMYGSWEEMMDAYLLGYQFWQGDPDVTADSPTSERRGYYKRLKKSDDNPYELDWNTKLKKSW